MQLVIGNKNYSSWSLRPWLLLNSFNIDFEEVLVSLSANGLSERLAQYSSSKKVPVLIDGDCRIWDSLAICQYVSDTYLQGKGWPEDILLKSRAYSIVCEMHSSFSDLRNELPMNCKARRKIDISSQVDKDVQRIQSIWEECFDMVQSQDIDEPWLLGGFSIADCFYAPVASRFKTYEIVLSEKSQNYCERILQHPSMLAWYKSAELEDEIINEDEAGMHI